MTEYIERETACAFMQQLDDEDVELYGVKIAEGFDGERAINALKSIPAADVRPAVRGKWEKVGEQMLINLENAREQYAELGYPHRKILNLRCSSCRKVTMVDSSIAYDFCPHCGADMRGDNK